MNNCQNAKNKQRKPGGIQEASEEIQRRYAEEFKNLDKVRKEERERRNIEVDDLSQQISDRNSSLQQNNTQFQSWLETMKDDASASREAKKSAREDEYAERQRFLDQKKELQSKKRMELDSLRQVLSQSNRGDSDPQKEVSAVGESQGYFQKSDWGEGGYFQKSDWGEGDTFQKSDWGEGEQESWESSLSGSKTTQKSGCLTQ